ncbi:MAG: hypothetical protein AB7O57_13285, partial [Hyphomicrobiaceae bacterium]
MQTSPDLRMPDGAELPAPRLGPVRHHASLDEVDTAGWNALFPGSPEDWAFYRAIEESPPEGFRLGALTIPGRDGGLAAAVPVFQIDYRLDTPFQGRMRAVADWVNRRRPGLTSLGVVGLGSPLSDSLSLGFDRQLDAGGRERALASMLGWLGAEADRTRAAIVAVKSMGAEATAFDPLLATHDFSKVTSVPVVTLAVEAPSLEAYLKGLKRQHRSYFRNKLKTLPEIRVEMRSSAEGLEAELVRLYEATLAQSGVS